jgi:ferredoxin-NADP reductase
MGMRTDDPLGEFDPTRAVPIVAPTNMIPVQVTYREVAAPGVVTVYIVLPGTRQSPAPYLPGQFVTLALPTPRETLYRSYSLCGDGDGSEPWSLTIKRLEQGAVSTYFYKHVAQGTLLYSSLPRGTFTLPAQVHPELSLVMIAAGSGVTPIMGMLRYVDRLPPEERPLVHLHYASKTVEDIIFRRELAAMDRGGTWLRQWHYLSSEGNRMTADAIMSRSGGLATRGHWYMCGPDALKRDVQEQLQRFRVPADRIHSEVFATAPGAAYRVTGALAGADGHIRVADTGDEFDVSPQETLLTALERQGYRPRFSCRAGACGECKLRLLDGQVDPVGEALSQSERDAGYVLSCIARPIGEVTLATGGRPPDGVARIASMVAEPPAPGTRRARMAALVGAGVLLVGSWNLTNHRPASWDVVQAAPAATQPAATTTNIPTTSPTAGRPGAPTATHAAGGGGGTGGGGGGTPKATATPTAKPTPKPTPTCISTPTPNGKKC